MLSLTVVLEIRRLLAAGELTQRAIASQLGVSRGIVSLIAQGRRGPHGRESYGREPPHRAAASDLAPGVPVRCPGCGGKVYLPCRLCEARAQVRRRLAMRTFAHAA